MSRHLCGMVLKNKTFMRLDAAAARFTENKIMTMSPLDTLKIRSGVGSTYNIRFRISIIISSE